MEHFKIKSLLVRILATGVPFVLMITLLAFGFFLPRYRSHLIQSRNHSAQLLSDLITHNLNGTHQAPQAVTIKSHFVQLLYEQRWILSLSLYNPEGKLIASASQSFKQIESDWWFENGKNSSQF